MTPGKNQTDDHLDAMVSYVLGKLWLTGDNSVRLYGNANVGALLLPVHENTQELSSRLKARGEV